MKPHTFAQMVNEIRDLAFDFGTCEQFRDRVSELLGGYIDPDAKAHAVVVPEPDGSSAGLVNVRSWIGAIGPVGAIVWVDPWEAMKAAGVRAIPTDRVLGEGMVQVRLEWLRDVLALLMDFDNAPAPVSMSQRLYALLSAPEALVPNNRANQGGAAT